MQEKLKVKDPEKVPMTPAGRISHLMELPNKDKKGFLPPEGFTFAIGPFIYKVSAVNVGDMRFSAKIHDVVMEGVND